MYLLNINDQNWNDPRASITILLFLFQSFSSFQYVNRVSCGFLKIATFELSSFYYINSQQPPILLFIFSACSLYSFLTRIPVVLSHNFQSICHLLPTTILFFLLLFYSPVHLFNFVYKHLPTFILPFQFVFHYFQLFPIFFHFFHLLS